MYYYIIMQPFLGIHYTVHMLPSYICMFLRARKTHHLAVGGFYDNAAYRCTQRIICFSRAPCCLANKKVTNKCAIPMWHVNLLATSPIYAKQPKLRCSGSLCAMAQWKI